MKRFLLAVAFVIAMSTIVETASAQYPVYGPYYAPPVRYQYNYIYQNPSPAFPNGFYMYNYNVRPAYYAPGPIYINAWDMGYRW